MAYLYRHIRLDKNVPFYIGIGSDPEYLRARERARRSPFWKKIVAKTDYRIEIMFDEISYEEAKEKEKEFIALYGRKDLLLGSLVNMTDGGDGTVNKVITDEYRKKLSDAAKGKIISPEQREKMRISQTGFKHSLEAREKMSKAHKGRPCAPSTIEKLRDRRGEKNPCW
jgi:hypothetical protein